MIWDDFCHKLNDQVGVPIATYLSQFPEIRVTILCLASLESIYFAYILQMLIFCALIVTTVFSNFKNNDDLLIDCFITFHFRIKLPNVEGSSLIMTNAVIIYNHCSNQVANEKKWKSEKYIFSYYFNCVRCFCEIRIYIIFCNTMQFELAF